MDLWRLMMNRFGDVSSPARKVTDQDHLSKQQYTRMSILWKRILLEEVNEEEGVVDRVFVRLSGT